MARRALAAVAALAAAMPAAALFSTTLHGAPTEVVQPGTPGVATMQLQPWLTTIDPDVCTLCRCAHATLAQAALSRRSRALRSRARDTVAVDTREACADPLLRPA